MSHASVKPAQRRVVQPDPRPEHYEPWHLHIGSVQIIIVGPGHDAWFPCSRPEYRIGHRPGTDIERAIANRTIERLRTGHRTDKDLGPAGIRRVWETVCREFATDPESILI